MLITSMVAFQYISDLLSQVSVAEVINQLTGGLLKNSVHYIQPILACAPHSIMKVLIHLVYRVLISSFYT